MREPGSRLHAHLMFAWCEWAQCQMQLRGFITECLVNVPVRQSLQNKINDSYCHHLTTKLVQVLVRADMSLAIVERKPLKETRLLLFWVPFYLSLLIDFIVLLVFYCLSQSLDNLRWNIGQFLAAVDAWSTAKCLLRCVTILLIAETIRPKLHFASCAALCTRLCSLSCHVANLQNWNFSQSAFYWRSARCLLFVSHTFGVSTQLVKS